MYHKIVAEAKLLKKKTKSKHPSATDLLTEHGLFCRQLQNIIKKGSIQSAFMGGSEEDQLSIIVNEILANKNVNTLTLKSAQVGERLSKTTCLANGLPAASERARRCKQKENKTDSREYWNNLSSSFLSAEGHKKKNGTPKPVTPVPTLSDESDSDFVEVLNEEAARGHKKRHISPIINDSYDKVDVLDVPSALAKSRGEVMKKHLKRCILATSVITSPLTKKADRKSLMEITHHDSIASMYSADADDDENGGCSQELLTFCMTHISRMKGFR
eukprot:11201325-Ditylum_brightwellii.AAC.1